MFDCSCVFDPYDEKDWPELVGEESCHYLRTCEACGEQWYGLHCPHEGHGSLCSSCKKTT